jgi:hypothetical protein
MLEAFLVLGAVLNVVASTITIRATIRNSIMQRENLSMAEKIGKVMLLMKELRDLIGRDLEDPFDAGNDRQKEVRH